jgi:hypothetical protein
MLLLIAAQTACSRPESTSRPLTQVTRKTLEIVLTTLSSPEHDDGFGSALAYGRGQLWIGAPHGSEGRVYSWDGAEMTLALSGDGRLGSHLAAKDQRVWVAAPLANQVTDQNGMVVTGEKSGVGIALSTDGHIAWAEGWLGPNGSEGASPGRPTSLLAAGNQLAIGMAHGTIALSVGTLQWSRPHNNDEAGFSLAAANIEGTEIWLVGAPASNMVYALAKTDLHPMRTWTGTGRFGHALAVADLDSDGKMDLIVGAPIANSTGEVTVFSDFGPTGSTIDLDAAMLGETGTTLLAGKHRLFIGAPGGATTTGRVFMVPLGR